MIDVDELRAYLMRYFGTSPFSWKVAAVAKIEVMSVEELVTLAINEGINLTQFEI